MLKVRIFLENLFTTVIFKFSKVVNGWQLGCCEGRARGAIALDNSNDFSFLQNLEVTSHCTTEFVL